MDTDNMLQYELIEGLKDIVDKLIENETVAMTNLTDDGLDTLKTIKYLVDKYDQINEAREI